MLNIAKIIMTTQTEGPGNRFAIWLQGCIKRCKNCCNPDFLTIKPANFVTSEKINKLISDAKQKYNIEGISLLGGEPVIQAQGLVKVAKFCKENNLSVILFTGYKLSQLKNKFFKGIEELKFYCDVIIDGEYQEKNKETKRNWVGSTNQNFHYLSNFYNPDIETMPINFSNEYRIDKNGNIIMNGSPLS